VANERIGKTHPARFHAVGAAQLPRMEFANDAGRNLYFLTILCPVVDLPCRAEQYALWEEPLQFASGKPAATFVFAGEQIGGHL